MAIKAVAFDLDGTLTQHKQKLSEEHRHILYELGKKYEILMVGAGTCERIYKQMKEFPITIIGNYGMMRSVIENNEFKMVRDLSVPCDRESVDARVTAFREKHGFTEFAGRNVEFHPSGCVTIPILGTDAKVEDKLAFDPDRAKRRALYEEVKALFPEYTVFVGGSSSYDMTPAPYEKAFALKEYADEKGYAMDEIVYVGDDYGPGGGDETVLKAGFPFIKVDDYRDFPEKVAFLLDEK